MNLPIKFCQYNREGDVFVCLSVLGIIKSELSDKSQEMQNSIRNHYGTADYHAKVRKIVFYEKENQASSTPPPQSKSKKAHNRMP